MSLSNLAAVLRSGLRDIDGIDPEQGTVDKLLSYLEQLQRWNRTFNLTAVRNPQEMVTRHLLDSLAVLPWIGAGHLLDAGSGAGLPGIPLAICRPQLDVTLLDSAGKKIRFLNHIRRQLDLDNIYPVQERLELFEPEVIFGDVISRAFSSLRAFASAARHLECERLLAMKGKNPTDELAELPDWVIVNSVEKLEVPGLQADRHLVIMSFKDES